jgi:hypothetical protein
MTDLERHINNARVTKKTFQGPNASNALEKLTVDMMIKYCNSMIDLGNAALADKQLMIARKVATKLLRIDIELHSTEPLKSWLIQLVYDAKVATGFRKKRKE